MTDVDLIRRSFSEDYDLYKNGGKTYVLKRKPFSENYDLYDLYGNLYTEGGLAFELKRKPWSSKYDLYKGGELFSGVIGGVTWLPTNIGGNVIWLRSDYAWQDAAKSVPCTNNSLIWTGEDKSGLVHDVVQATEAKRPVYLTNQINGHPAWRFDSVDDYLKAVAFTLNQPVTIFCVGRHTVDAIMRVWYDGNTWAGMLFYWNGAAYKWYAEADLGSGLPIVDSWMILTGKYNGANSEVYLNGTSKGTGNIGANNSGGFTLGANANGVYNMNGDVAEIIVYDSILSDIDRQRVELYLNTEAQGTGYAIY